MKVMKLLCHLKMCETLFAGSPDCIVRLWSTFVPQKVTCIFQGHHASIVAVIIQKEGRQIISISKDRCVKVWDVAFQNCIQIYMEIPASLGEHSAMKVFYNPLNHSIFVGRTRSSGSFCVVYKVGSQCLYRGIAFTLRGCFLER